MPPERKPSTKDGSSNIFGGAAGAGGGTLLVLLAQNMPDSHPTKKWFIIIAPSASIVLSSIWFWAKSKLVEYFKTKEFYSAIEEAKNTCKEALKRNPPEEERKTIEKELKKLSILKARHKIDRVKVLQSRAFSDTA